MYTEHDTAIIWLKEGRVCETAFVIFIGISKILFVPFLKYLNVKSAIRRNVLKQENKSRQKYYLYHIQQRKFSAELSHVFSWN